MVSLLSDLIYVAIISLPSAITLAVCAHFTFGYSWSEAYAAQAKRYALYHFCVVVCAAWPFRPIHFQAVANLTSGALTLVMAFMALRARNQMMFGEKIVETEKSEDDEDCEGDEDSWEGFSDKDYEDEDEECLWEDVSDDEEWEGVD